MSNADETTTDEPEDRTIDELVDELFYVREKIFEHVGYVEQWRDMPFEDSRDNYWSVDSGFGSKVKFSPSHEALAYWLEEHDDEYGPHGDKLFDHEIYSGRHDATHGIHRGAELTMICVDTNTDGNMFFQLFRNDHEVKLEPDTTNEEPPMLPPMPSSLLGPPSPDVVYVRTETGSDETGDGTSVANAYRSIERAVKDVATRCGAEAYCVIDFDGAGEVGKRFTVRR